MKFSSLSLALLAFGTVALAQPTRNIGGSLSADLNLYKDTCYLLTSSLVAPSGYKVDIQEGTTILCDPQTSIVIERGAQIIAAGTVSEPIVFTSNQAINSRAPGDWGGLLLSGYAANNIVDNGGGTYNVFRSGANRTGGGTPIYNTDNSGTLSYVRIEFAGGGATGETEVHGLALNSVGSGTTINNIQVSECLQDGIWMAGGSANIQTAFVLNVHQNGIKTFLGNQSLMQSLLILQRDPNAHNAVGTYSMYIENNQANPSNQPKTHPVVSNLSALGINYCNVGTPHADFKDGIYLANNTEADIFNSFVTGQAGYGLYIEDAITAQQTAVNQINVSYNSFTGNGAGDIGQGFTPWLGNGCGTSMLNWLSGAAICGEIGNQFSSFNAAYDASFCGDYCNENFVQAFVLDGEETDLSPLQFTGLPGYFEELDYRGAIQETDHYASWTGLCASTQLYCNAIRLKAMANVPTLLLHPNPARNYTDVQFEAEASGKAVISILDKVNGKIWYQTESTLQTAGPQQVGISFNNLTENVYTLRIVLKNKVLYGQIVVR